MSYREERREVYQEDIPVERRVVEERHVVGDPAYDATRPLATENVREQVVDTRYAAPVRDDLVSERVVEDEATGRLSTLDLASRLIWFLTALLLADLTARFVLKATGANAASSFVGFVYNTTAPFVAPFAGIFGTPSSGNAVLEPATVVAIIVYAVIAFFLVWLLGIILGGPSRGIRAYRRDSHTYR